MDLSTGAARAALTTYAGQLRQLLGKLPETTKQLGESIGRLWLGTYTQLDKLEGDLRHVPADDRTLAQDLDDVASKRTQEIFDEVKPVWASGTQARCMNSTYRQVFQQLLQQQSTAAAANRAAAEQFAPKKEEPAPVQDPEAVRDLQRQHSKLRQLAGVAHPTEGQVEQAALEAAVKKKIKEQAKETAAAQQSAEELPAPARSLVQLLLSRADGTAEPEESGTGKSGNGNGDPALRAAAVSPTLARAASRLLNPGPPDLRVESSKGEMAQHMLQEKWSFTDWAEAQGLSGAALREAKTHARSMELGVADYGVEYLMSRSAEVQARRMLALALTAASGNYRLGAQLEELPGEGVPSTLPDSLAKSLAERLKLELKVEQMQKEAGLGLRK